MYASMYANMCTYVFMYLSVRMCPYVLCVYVTVKTCGLYMNGRSVGGYKCMHDVCMNVLVTKKYIMVASCKNIEQIYAKT